MRLRNLRRRIFRLKSDLSVPDHDVSRPAGRIVLFSCHDADRSMNLAEGRFSPKLEGIRSIMADLGLASVNLTHPFAIFPGSQIKGGSITINRRLLALRLRTKLGRVTRSGAGGLEGETALYRSMLEGLRPEIVISIQPPYAMCRAARQLGITVVEAMHGTHYNPDNRVYLAHMKNRDELLPNILLSFDDVSHATMQLWTKGRDIAAVQAADPWQHALRLAQSRSEGKVSAEEAARRRRSRVLVTLQWGYDGERDTLSNIIPNGILHPALEEAMARAGDSLRFLIRMHPIQMNKPGYGHHRSYIQSLAGRLPNVEWERATNEPLPVLLDEVCAHITMSSSSVGEAAAAGVPSLTLCPTLHPGGAHHGYFRELAAEGLVTFGKPEADSILAWIGENASRVAAPPQYDAEGKHLEELDFYAGLIERAGSALDARQRKGEPRKAS